MQNVPNYFIRTYYVHNLKCQRKSKNADFLFNSHEIATLKIRIKFHERQ